MTPPSERPFKWRHSPDAPITVSAAAFTRLVAENDLRTIEANGYLWAWLPTEDGRDAYRTYGPKWAYLYQARRVATQANVGGGAVVVDITVPTGMTARLVNAQQKNSGTNTCNASVIDEDNAQAMLLGYAASGAATYINLPSIGSSAGATANYTHSLDALFGPGQKLSVYQSGAGAQNDTMTVAVSLLLPISAAADGSDVTWSKARSTNEADVALAASTISAANTMQAVLLP